MAAATMGTVPEAGADVGTGDSTSATGVTYG